MRNTSSIIDILRSVRLIENVQQSTVMTYVVTASEIQSQNIDTNVTVLNETIIVRLDRLGRAQDVFLKKCRYRFNLCFDE